MAKILCKFCGKEVGFVGHNCVEKQSYKKLWKNNINVNKHLDHNYQEHIKSKKLKLKSMKGGKTKNGRKQNKKRMAKLRS